MSTEQHIREIGKKNNENTSPAPLDGESDRFSAISGVSGKNLMEISKMRKLEEARRKWETRHSTNSPFRADQFSASPLIESQNSPFTISKVYGMRHGFSEAAQL